MKPTLTQITQISIHPSQVNFYYQNHWDPYPPTKSRNNNNYFAFVLPDGTLYEDRTKPNNNFLNSARKSNGELSKIARKKLMRSLDYLLAWVV